MTGFHAILLAAGAGSRFGGGKLVAPWRGEALVRHAARAALAAPVERCIVVTGCSADEVEAALAGLDEERLTTVRATDWASGQAASLRTGVAALPSASQGVVVFLGDMPQVPHDMASHLLAKIKAGAQAAESVLTGDPPHPAHPVAFSRSLYPALLSLQGDRGGRDLLVGAALVAQVETHDPGATYDVDRRQDLP